MIYVLVLLIVSGVIAYLGDVLGTYIGKRRYSIFGMRPRITAVLISISAGILITLLTLLVSALLSDNVKIALFSVQQLNEERQKLASDVTSLSDERIKLEKSLSSLKDQIRVKEQEFVVYRKDTPLAAIVLKGNPDKVVVMASLTRLISLVSRKAGEQGLKVKEEKELLQENAGQLTKMAAHIAGLNEELILGAYAAENKNRGEPLGQVRFLLQPNPIIFKAGDEIATLEIDGGEDRSQIAKRLQAFMEELNHEVVKQGMIGNPLTGQFGDFSSESMLSFYDMVSQIKKVGRKITLIAVVKEDTYAIGPLNVAFRLEEEPGN